MRLKFFDWEKLASVKQTDKTKVPQRTYQSNRTDEPAGVLNRSV
jgi:hypothetical protein